MQAVPNYQPQELREDDMGCGCGIARGHTTVLHGGPGLCPRPHREQAPKGPPRCFQNQARAWECGSSQNSPRLGAAPRGRALTTHIKPLGLSQSGARGLIGGPSAWGYAYLLPLASAHACRLFKSRMGSLLETTRE
jgi:hypothetical protein